MFTTVSARMDSQLKEHAEDVLKKVGLSHSAAISALYSQIVLQQGMPFDLKIPATNNPQLLSLSKIKKSQQNKK